MKLFAQQGRALLLVTAVFLLAWTQTAAQSLGSHISKLQKEGDIYYHPVTKVSYSGEVEAANEDEERSYSEIDAISESPSDKFELKHKSKSKAEEADSARARRIDISSSFSYYFNYDKNGKGIFVDSTAPITVMPTHVSNLSLSMGMNLYKGVSAYFDLGIKDQIMKKAIDWGGRIGTKYFDLQVEYSFVGCEISYWEDANIGVNRNTPPDLKTDYDQTWITVALMYPAPSIGMAVGFIYTAAKVPALVWVNKDKEDKENRYAFLDKSCPVTTYGIRLHWDNLGFKRIPDNLPMGWTTGVTMRITADVGYGFAKPNEDVLAMAREKSGQNETVSKFV